MKIIPSEFFLSALGVLLSFSIYAQDPADDICNTLPSLIPGEGTCSSVDYEMDEGSHSGSDPGERSSCFEGGDDNESDGWYQFTATASRTSVSVSGDEDRILAVYSGGCGSLTEVACDRADDNNDASVTVATTIGTTYYVQIHQIVDNSWWLFGFIYFQSQMEGEICIVNDNSPADDPCDSKPSLTPAMDVCSGISYELDSDVHTRPDNDERSSCFPGGVNRDDGWYQFTAISPLSTVEATGNADRILAVYEDDCGTLAELGCHLASSGNVASVSVETNIGDTYFVQLHRVSRNNNFDMEGEICVFGSKPVAPGGVSSDLELWLKANDGVFENEAGTNNAEPDDFARFWQDHSPAGRNATEGGGSGTRTRFTENALNFNPGLTFTDDGDFHLKTGSNPVSEDMSLFAVYRTSQQEDGGDFWNCPQLLGAESDGLINDYALGLANGNAFLKAFPGNGYGPRTAANTADGAAHVVSGTRDQAPAGRSYLFVNGIEDGSAVSGNAPLSDPPGVAIGHSISVSHVNNKFDGEIPEVIMYSEDLNPADRNKIESYLAVKYGATLGSAANPVDYTATDGTVIWTGDAAYQNDIAGVGRDDFEALEQKQSKSQNEDAIFTMGNYSIAATNSANANSFGSDISYFAWGNNNEALNSDGVYDIGITNNGEVIERRLARIWKSQETGTVSTLKIQVDMSNIQGVTSPGDNDLANVRLLVDQDGAFDIGATSVTPASYDNATQVVEFDHDFNSTTGFYFTLSSVDQDMAPLPVEIISVQATEQNGHVLVSWQTASETNNKEFVIERSPDGVAWTAVGSRPGAGTSNELNTYHFPDNTVFGGDWYYRIMQVDEDNTTKYSQIVYIELRNPLLKIYPNPATAEELYMELPGKRSDGKTDYVFLDSKGMEVMRGEVFPGAKHKVNISMLPSGTYFVKIFLKERVAVEKVVVE